MKISNRILFFSLVSVMLSCSEKKDVRKPLEKDPISAEELKIKPAKVTKPSRIVKVAWKIPIEPAGSYFEYVSVNPSLANRIIAALDSGGESMSAVPELKQPRLKVDQKEYRLYPHTLIDEKAKKAYKIENVYKDLYRDWIIHVNKLDLKYFGR